MIYFLVFLFLLLSPRNKKIGACVFFILISLISACRYNVGYDYENYLAIILNPNIDSTFTRLEPTSKFLIEVSRYFNFPQFYFIVTSFFITLFFTYIIYKESPDLKLSFILYYSIPIFFFGSLSIIRQMLACGIAFLMIYFWRHKKYTLAFLCLFFGGAVHISVFICCLLPIAALRFWNRELALTFWWVSILIGLFFAPYISMFFACLDSSNPFLLKAQNFIIEQRDLRGYKGILYLFNFIYIMILIFYYEKLKSWNPDYIFYFNVTTIGICLMNCFSSFGVTGGRISIFFFTPFLLLIAAIPYIEHKKYYILSKTMIIACSFFLFCYTLYLSYHHFHSGITDKDAYFPYQTFWSGQQ